MYNIAVLYSYAPQKGIIDGFRANRVGVSSYYYGVESSFLPQKLIYLLLIKLFGIYPLLNFKFNLNIIKVLVFQSKYDLLVLIKPKKFCSFTLHLCKNYLKIKTIIVTTDSIHRYPDQIAFANYSSKIYIQDAADLNLVKNSSWLPLGFDSKLFYHNHKRNDRKVDVLLFGNCTEGPYSSRMRYFLEASKLALKGYKVVFIGGGISSENLERLRVNGVQVNSTVPLFKLADHIRNAKVAINIHQDDGGMPVNPMFFAIPACGTIQITDVRDYYSNWGELNTSYFPRSLNDLNFAIIQLLNDFDEISDKLKKINNLSYIKMAEKILKDNQTNTISV